MLLGQWTDYASLPQSSSTSERRHSTGSLQCWQVTCPAMQTGIQLASRCVRMLQGSRTNSNHVPASASQRAGLADEHHAQGYAFRKQGNFAAAIKEYSHAISLEPSHFKALFNRGFSWDKARFLLKFAGLLGM